MRYQLSTVDLDQTPPSISIPREYNAAYDLIGRNLDSGRGDRIAYIDDNEEITFSELDVKTTRIGSGLTKMGLSQEQRLFLCVVDSIDWPAAFLGAIKAGIVPIAANTLLTPDDYRYMLEDSRAKVAVISPHFIDVFTPLLKEVETLESLIIAGDSDGSFTRLSAVEGSGDPGFVGPATTADDPCFWLYSSGSTGSPKGTVHIHSSMMYTAALFAQGVLKLTEEDRVFSAAKLFFAYGLGNALSFPLSCGASTVLMAERPTPDAVFKRLIDHQPTLFCGVPTLYAAMLASSDMPGEKDLNLRISTSAGEALPEDLLSRWTTKVGSGIVDGIGSTEMLHIYLSNAIDDIQAGSTGRPVPGYDIKLVDADGAEVPQGEIGDLVVKGPSSAIMYWNKRQKSVDTFKGEWTHSGDKFSVNEAGYYVYAGRTDDMLKVSGIYVSPAEVEATLVKHPAVLEAAVVGANDENQLIKPKAYLVLNKGFEGNEALSQELKDFIKENLAPHKYPRWFVYVEDLPKTATGKIQRFKLRELD